MAALLDLVILSDLEPPNCIIMAPLTRYHANEGHVPNALMTKYYTQRAGADLVLNEATAVMPIGVGCPGTSDIWSDDQIHGWDNVTKAMHAADGYIFLRLWHAGWVSDPFYLNDELPMAPSVITAERHISLVRPERLYVTPCALGAGEIASITETCH